MVMSIPCLCLWRVCSRPPATGGMPQPPVADEVWWWFLSWLTGTISHHCPTEPKLAILLSWGPEGSSPSNPQRWRCMGVGDGENVLLMHGHLSLILCFRFSPSTHRAPLVAQTMKNLPAMQEIWVQTSPMSGRSWEGNGNPFQYSCLENSMDRGAWWAVVHGVTKGQIGLSN